MAILMTPFSSRPLISGQMMSLLQPAAGLPSSNREGKYKAEFKTLALLLLSFLLLQLPPFAKNLPQLSPFAKNLPQLCLFGKNLPTTAKSICQKPTTAMSIWQKPTYHSYVHLPKTYHSYIHLAKTYLPQLCLFACLQSKWLSSMGR